MKLWYFYLAATARAVLFISPLYYCVAANIAYANGPPPTRPNPCPTLTVGCCPSVVARPDGEDQELEAVSATASKTMDTYSEIAKQGELFYEKAFNQFVQILNGTGLLLFAVSVVITAIIGFFLASEQKSIKALRLHYQERLDLIVEEAAKKAEKKFEDTYGAMIQNIQTNTAEIGKVKSMAFEETRALAALITGIGQLTIAEIRVVDRVLAKQHLHVAERFLASAGQHWEKLELRDKAGTDMLAFICGTLAYAKKRLGDIQGALDMIETAVKYSPSTAAYLFNAGCYAALCSHRARSLEYFTRAISVDPSYKTNLRNELEKRDAKAYADDAAFKALVED